MAEQVWVDLEAGPLPHEARDLRTEIVCRQMVTGRRGKQVIAARRRDEGPVVLQILTKQTHHIGWQRELQCAAVLCFIGWDDEMPHATSAAAAQQVYVPAK